LGLSGGMTRNYWPSTSVTSGGAAGDAPAYAYVTDTAERDKQLSAALTPQLSWKLDGGATLNLTALLQLRRVMYGDEAQRSALTGDGFDFAADELTARDQSRLARATLD